MKFSLKRVWRSGLAMMLALCMLVGMCPAVFAADDDSADASLADLYSALEKVAPEVLESLYNYADENGYIDSLNNAIDKVADLVTAKQEAVANVKEEAANQLAELEADLAEQQAQLTDLQVQMDELLAELEEITGEAPSADLQEKIDDINAKLEKVNEAIDVANEAIDAAYKAMDELMAAYDVVEAKLHEIEIAAFDFEAAVAELSDLMVNGAKLGVSAIVNHYEEAKAVALAALAALEAVYSEDITVDEIVAKGEAAVEKAVEEYKAAMASLRAELEAIPEDLEASLNEVVDQAVVEAEAKAREEIEAEFEARFAEKEEALREELAAAGLSEEEIDAEVEAKKEELKAEVDADIEEKIAEKKAETEAELNAKVASVTETLEGATAMVDKYEAKIIAAAEKVVELVKEYAPKAVELAKQLLEEIKPELAQIKEDFKAVYYDATHEDYDYTCVSNYVALGDATVSAEGNYAGIVAGKLGINHTNLGADVSDVSELYTIIEQNASVIAGADLISLGYNSNVFTRYAVNQVLTYIYGTYTAPDWATLVGADRVHYIESAMSEVNSALRAVGIEGEYQGKPMSELMAVVVESYAYASVEYVCNIPFIANEIRALNEDAVIMLVGMYNPLKNVDIVVGDAKVSVGNYLQMLIDAVNVESTVYALVTGNAVYVDAIAVQTVNTATELTVEQMLSKFGGKYKGAEFAPSADGQQYIANRILNALDFVDEHLHKYVNCVCTLCGDVNVYRLSGANRVETAIEIADEMKELMGVDTFDTIIIASGYNFADALTGSYLANAKSAPILLHLEPTVQKNLDYIEANLAEDGVVYILGGKAAVPYTVDKALEDAGVTVKRLWGATRYETNIAILEEVGVTADQEILVCTGVEFADSLSASATGLPIMLVNNSSKKLSSAQVTYLNSLEGNELTIVGGEAAVSPVLESALNAYDAEIERVFGRNRYETAIELANRYFSDVDVVTIAAGQNYPDGLAGGPLCYLMGQPLLLTYELDYITDMVAEYVNDNNPSKGIVLGGNKAIYDKTVCDSYMLPAGTIVPTK